ncbi:MAG TPA: CDP-alcohol phosphatidyltransferase family protein [Methanoregulaceae archaeon]|nr:CDP-alcohol phosphatidyltransferase family protein [Methanoregulaceae archaeon]HQJ87654.1 CDP-alcohol phosphatidyltransferase family protein [Methanoregulaceae archaeon]
MTLDSYRPHVAGVLDLLVRIAIRLRLTPNQLSTLSFVLALAGGLLYAAGSIAGGLVCVAANAVFDAVDGALARATGRQGPRGDFLDHAIDRYADIFIITGIFAGGFASWQIGVFALTGVLMASYLGTQAQAVGVGRYYGGVLGRADRLVLLMAASLLDLAFGGTVGGMRLLGWTLVLFGLLGHFTALQRFVWVWRRVG